MAFTPISFRPDDESHADLTLVTSEYGSTSEAIRHGLALAAQQIRFRIACDEALAELIEAGAPEPTQADREWAARTAQ